MQKLYYARRSFGILTDLIDCLDDAANAGLVTIIDIDSVHTEKLEFGYETMINVMLFCFDTDSTSTEIMRLATIDLGRRRGDESRVYYHSTYSLFYGLYPGLRQNDFEFSARFSFEDRDKAMLFKLRYG